MLVLYFGSYYNTVLLLKLSLFGFWEFSCVPLMSLAVDLLVVFSTSLFSGIAVPPSSYYVFLAPVLELAIFTRCSDSFYWKTLKPRSGR